MDHGPKILVIGSGGRENALCWRLSKNAQVFCAPGNPGTQILASNVAIQPDDIERLTQFAIKNQIALIVVGPEAPLVAGIADRFHAKNLPIARRSSSPDTGEDDLQSRVFDIKHTTVNFVSNKKTAKLNLAGKPLTS